MDAHEAKYRYNLKVENLSTYMKHVEEVLDILLSKATQLPIVDEEGFSECPFAEKLYAYKEEAVELVKEECKDLEPYLEIVKEEIERCQKNLEQIQKDEGKLELNETKEQYEWAREKQQYELDQYIGFKKALIDLLTRKEELLKMAKEERHTWPLEAPTKKEDHFNPEDILNAVADGTYQPLRHPYDFMTMPSAPAVPSKNDHTSELSSLISLGPLY